MGKKRNNEMTGITRCPQQRKGYKAWRFNILRGESSQFAYFPDNMFGGEEASLQAAITFRKIIMEQLETMPPEVVINKQNFQNVKESLYDQKKLSKIDSRETE